MAETSDKSGALIDIARGDRGYIHSIDMIEAAPVGPETDSFQFRFFSLATAPGRWIAASEGADKDHANAEVRVEQGDLRETYFFACPDGAGPLKPAVDFDFQIDKDAFSIEDMILNGPLDAGYDIWQQLTEAIRYAGSVVYPGVVWFTVALSGNRRLFDPVEPGSNLRMDLRRALGQRNMVPFSTSYGAEGRFIALQRPDD